MINSVDPDQLASIYTVCKGRVYPGSAGQGLKPIEDMVKVLVLHFITIL